METQLSSSIWAYLGRHKNVVSKQFFQPTDPTNLEVKPRFQRGKPAGSRDASRIEASKRLVLRLLAGVLRLPWARGRVTISEFVYRLLSPQNSMVEMRINHLPLTVDLAEQEARYIYFGAFECNEIEFMQRWVKPGDTVVDVGANIGYISAILAGAVGSKGKIYAFEPNPIIFPQLRTLAKASAGRIEAFQSAITDKSENGVTDFYIVSDHSMWSSTVIEGDGSGLDRIQVPSISLSEFIANGGLSRVDFIKIDVEGGEADVLRGASQFLTDGGKPIIMCELAASLVSVRTQSFAAVERLLVDFGYRAFLIAPGGKLSPMLLSELKQQTHTFNIVLLPATVRTEEALG